MNLIQNCVILCHIFVRIMSCLKGSSARMYFISFWMLRFFSFIQYDLSHLLRLSWSLKFNTKCVIVIIFTEIYICMMLRLIHENISQKLTNPLKIPTENGQPKYLLISKKEKNMTSCAVVWRQFFVYYIQWCDEVNENGYRKRGEEEAESFK